MNNNRPSKKFTNIGKTVSNVNTYCIYADLAWQESILNSYEQDWISSKTTLRENGGIISR